MKNRAKTQKLLNITQLAKLLGVSRRVVHYRLSNGTLPIQNVDGMKPPKWLLSDVEAFLGEQPNETKICTKCKIEKTLNKFPRSSNANKDYHISWCRECCENNRENQIVMLTVKTTNTSKRRHVAKYYQTIKGRASSLVIGARLRAKQYGHVFDITKEFIEKKIENGVCEKSGLPFNLSIKITTRRNPFGPSIDRIDNNKGYTKDNVQVVCNMYNGGKNEHKELDFIAMCIAVAENNASNIEAIERLKELRNARL